MGFPKLWSRKWWAELIVRREMSKMKWLRKYPLMFTVFVGGVASIATVAGYPQAAEFLLKVAEGYTEPGVSMDQFVVLIVGLLQAGMVLVKFWRDRSKGKKLAAKGIKDRRR